MHLGFASKILVFIHFLLLLHLQRKGVAAAGTLAGDRDVQECLGDRASRRRRYSCALYYYDRDRLHGSVHVVCVK